MADLSFWSLLGMKEDPLYKWIFGAFWCLVILNLITFLVGLPRLTFLESSESQWWGNITSIGLFDSWESLEIILILPISWLLTNRAIIKSERKIRSLVFLLTSFFGAILANCIWSFSQDGQGILSYGVSGIGMSAIGLILVFSLVNIINLVLSRSNFADPMSVSLKENITLRNLQLVVCILSCAASAAISVIVLSDRGANVNSFVHEVSLAIGVTGSITYEFVRLVLPYASPSMRGRA